MNISYSQWSIYKECSKKFSLQYIERAKPCEVVNEYHTLYGKLLGRYFELYCNEWRFKTPYLFPDIIRERCERLFNGIMLTSCIDWSAPGCSLSSDQILDQACKDIVAIMESPNLNYFLATQAEVEITIKLSSGDSINARLDFIHTNVDKTVLIMDGKGSKHKGKYTKNEQLYFYALLYYLHYKKLPDSLGFFYYRHNSYDPIPFNLEILNDFRARLSLDIKDMIGGKPPVCTPSAKSCKFCLYLSDCKEGMESKKSRSRGSKVNVSGEGLQTFGF
jgi:hypothetical protein